MTLENNLTNEIAYIECFKGEAKPKQVKNMKLENWNTNIAKVRAWMSNGLDDEATKVALETTIALGENASDDDARSTFWTALRSIGSQAEGFPKARVGQPSLLSSEGQVNVANVVSQVVTAFASITDETSRNIVLSVIVPHGRTGGVYADWNAFCEAMSNDAHNYMMKSIKEERWDGEAMNKAGVPQITPTLTKAERDASAGDDEGGDTQDE